MSPLLGNQQNEVTGYRPKSWPGFNAGGDQVPFQPDEQLAHPWFLLTEEQRGAMLAVGGRISENVNPFAGPVGRAIILTRAQVQLAAQVLAVRKAARDKEQKAAG